MVGNLMNNAAIEKRMAEIVLEMGEISAHSQPTLTQEARFTELTIEFDGLDADRRANTLARIRSVADDPGSSGLGAVQGAFGSDSSDHSYDRDPFAEPRAAETFRGRDPWDLRGVQIYGRSQAAVATEYRSRALSAIEKMPGASSAVRSAATRIVEEFDDARGDLSRVALALSEPAYLRAWCKLAQNPLGADLDEGERVAVSRVKELSRAMSLTDSAGGYLIPFQLDPTVIITANGSVNQIRLAARQVVAISDTWNGVSAAAVSWSYDAEAAEVSDDAPTFAGPSIPIYKAQGFVPISLEAMMDAANATQEIGRLLAFGKDVLEASSFAIGSGVGQPTGIVTALTGTASVVNTATSDVFALADVYSLQGALPARYRNMPSTAWLGHNLTYNRIRQFDTSGGGGLWATVGQDRPDRLLNRQVLESEDMDGVIDAGLNNYLLIFGDFSNYVIADRIAGMTVEFVPHLFGASRRPTGQRGWLAWVRHGADSVNNGAFRMLQS
jgi:HK97 family phage major capsid protein